ncbi:hypothetical protein DF3PB_4190002 [uncultured Defluviicoccus sp.]|uniref:Uncharacterized protein n=1 Tax=metagenome TaxID=256318 RepID=A0A380TH53_9ZZZZ|nr:hypothetical protein DF3PB_4190002 [uncultured Defluviicoccus sp.]
MFLSERNPLLTLKRWFQTRLRDMAESVRRLREAGARVDADPALGRDLEVVRIHEQGSDWVLRDFDPTSRPLKAFGQDANATAARARVIDALRDTTDPILRLILRRITREPPSENIHWSPSRQKILVIDMQ